MNMQLEKYVLYGIFEKLKTTKNLKHISLANVGLNDEKLLVRYLFYVILSSPLLIMYKNDSN